MLLLCCWQKKTRLSVELDVHVEAMHVCNKTLAADEMGQAETVELRTCHKRVAIVDCHHAMTIDRHCLIFQLIFLCHNAKFVNKFFNFLNIKPDIKWIIFFSCNYSKLY